ncbi:Cocaine esterase [uncultured Roseburia sp.]|uniref:CocE/NonD family hydrolase n=1 Tax=Brotonthovivens ammoniilytica TaxID=2981725 RepID=A0ABT2TN38_9FIRM|nr:CocE/NonD family hydrolase [Brotonthovivens ammoniilytica]MCU6763653.1 CocE/NonD family hydrolase [Brotonthovivens ammoniilytica]SCJ29500.1 Cocaine esterase [uncultured Roseburia sp.]
MIRKRKYVKKQFGKEQIEVIFDPHQVYPKEQHPGVKRETVFLKKGSRITKESKPLACDMILEKDLPVELRDGTVIFTDVIRPAGKEAVPAVVAYSPYGKHVHSLHLPWGVPDGALSGLQKQEGPDPGFWVPAGYAVVQPDARGTYYSGGDNVSFGTAEALDGYDIIEWAAKQPWCSGKVGMSGNSYLAVAQFLTASVRPPHLAAIAPWEGFNDVYRQTSMCGGIPNFGFQQRIDREKEGFTYYENMAAMSEKYPLMNAYWEDKRIRLEDITVPAYIVGSYISKFHTYGTLEAFERIGSSAKWLRIHNTHEWSDLYEYQEDLKLFFDCYLKSIDNKWIKTPPVRLSVLNPGGKDIVNRPEEKFPLPDTEYKKIYLDNEKHCLTEEKPVSETKQGYRSDNRKDQLVFSMTMDATTETTGYFAAHLWVETESAHDLDLFVYVLKADAHDNLMPPVVYGAPFSGFEGSPQYTPCGRLRASLRETDAELSTESKPYLTFRHTEKLVPGRPVRVDIPLWPVGMIYEKGQKMQCIISGYEINKEEWPDLEPAASVNRGKAFIYTGGDKASYLTVPWVPGRKS